MSLQYLKKEVRNGVHFSHAENIKVSTSWHYRFCWKWLNMSKVPKIGSWQYFSIERKNIATAFVFYYVMQNIEVPVMFICYLFLGSCGQK